jgi:chromosome segregation ATPase
MALNGKTLNGKTLDSKTLDSKTRGNGWLEQAQRLAVAHGTWGAKSIVPAQRAQTSPPAADAEFDAEAREIELANKLELAQAKAAGLERRLAQESAAAQQLNEQLEILAADCETTDNRIAELETELGAARDEIALRDNENLSLQTSLDLATGENSRLSQYLKDGDSAFDATRARLDRLQLALATAEADRFRLQAEVDQAAATRHAESSTANGLLEAMTARAVTAERLLADVRECLLARIAENDVTERGLADATAARGEIDRKLRQFQEVLRLKQSQIDELEQSRSKLIETTNTLLKSFQSRDAAANHAEEKINLLTARVAELEAEVRLAASRQGGELRDFQAQPEAMRRVDTDEAGETTRKKWAELARELAKLVKLKHEFSASIQPRSAPALLASTITF